MARTTLPRAEPPALVAQPLVCRTCGLPPRNSPRLRRGRCDACYGYWYKHGQERPRRLWGRCFTGRMDKTT